MSKKLEQDHRATFRKLWHGWITTIQPNLGGSIGIPDIMIMAHPPQIVPIEAKRGTIVNGRLVCEEIRPNQVQWHTTFAIEGGKSWFYIGTPEGRLFLAPSMITIATRGAGTPISCSVLHELDATSSKAFTAQLRSILK